MVLDCTTVPDLGVATSNLRGRSPARTYVLTVVGGPARGTKLAFAKRPILVGNDETCDLVLHDPKVSRRHLEVRGLPGGTISVKDLDSKNGTFVDSVRLTDGVVPVGTTVRCGDTTLKLALGDVPIVAPSARDRFGSLAGESVTMREIFAVLELVSPTETTALIQGESGTGKELAARAIHDHSPRGGKPFVVVDCGATSEELIDSHLFGHQEGAFTGATSDRKGAFVEASGGTLFLDEIGELPLALQPKLLRALEAQTVQPLGCDQQVKVDTRVVAATNRNLQAMVEEGSFRFDLYYRLAVVHVLIPPLRERLEDLTSLIRFFYQGRGLEPGPIEGPGLERLQSHAWPGNVRELRNVLERAWVMTGSQAPRFTDLEIWLDTTEAAPDVIDLGLSFKEAKARWVAIFERRYLTAVFARSGFNISKAAESIGLNRHHLRKLLEEHGIRPSGSGR